jgi:hypothetical protein
VKKQMTSIKYPKGFRMREHTQVAVRFPDDLFKEIIAMAKAEKKDFNAMVLELVKCGKLDLEESDRLEPPKLPKKVTTTQTGETTQ